MKKKTISGLTEILADDGKYLTLSAPTYFHKFYNKVLVTNVEDYKEVTESERTQIEKNDSSFVSPPLSFIDLWNLAVGNNGKYNSETGYFEVSVLKDITYTQALECYDLSYNRPVTRLIFENFKARALLPTSPPYNQSANGLFLSSPRLELITIARMSSFNPTSILNTFLGCSNLKRIECLTYFNKLITNGASCFSGCTSLEYVNFGYVRCNLNLLWSPNLDLTTMRKMISSPEIAITITVHPDVYAKLIDEENTEWHEVLEDAIAKNITFVTV